MAGHGGSLVVWAVHASQLPGEPTMSYRQLTLEVRYVIAYLREPLRRQFLQHLDEGWFNLQKSISPRWTLRFTKEFKVLFRITQPLIW